MLVWKLEDFEMRQFFENKLAFAAVLLLFAMALAWNLSHGGSITPSPGSLTVTPDSAILEAIGPTLPPPPWEEVREAIGPTLPPPPWEEVRAV